MRETEASRPGKAEEHGYHLIMTTRRARELRANMTDAERRLWGNLRQRTLGFRFRRQAPIGPYITDFVCFEKRLVVEVDGGQHWGSRSDQARDAWLREQGFTVLRFWNHEVLENTEGVTEVIRHTLTSLPSHIKG